jgi:hypothetical protein
MSNIIKHKYSNTTGNVPSSLNNGEIAINQKDKILYYRDDVGTIKSFDLANPTKTIYSKIISTGTVSGTVSETEVLKITIPPNTIDNNGWLKFLPVFLVKSGTLGNAVFKIKISTNGILPSGTTNQIATYTMAATTAWARFERIFANYFGTLYNPVLQTTSLINDTALSTSAGTQFIFDRTITNYVHLSITLANSADASGIYGCNLTT